MSKTGEVNLKYLDIRVCAQNDSDMLSFLKLCGIIQGAGEAGHGTKIDVFVDGDGSGRYNFTIDNKKIPSLPERDKTLWLGE